MVSPVHANGSPWPRAADEDGVALARTHQRHVDQYPELAEGARGRLVVLGCEVGGRWSQPALEVLRNLAVAKSREAPSLLRRSAALAWHRRWLSHLSVAAQLALAETLLAPLSPHLSEFDAAEPFLGDILVDHARGEPPVFSRLPLRG